MFLSTSLKRDPRMFWRWSRSGGVQSVGHPWLTCQGHLQVCPQHSVSFLTFVMNSALFWIDLEQSVHLCPFSGSWPFPAGSGQASGRLECLPWAPGGQLSPGPHRSLRGVPRNPPGLLSLLLLEDSRRGLPEPVFLLSCRWRLREGLSGSLPGSLSVTGLG